MTTTRKRLATLLALTMLVSSLAAAGAELRLTARLSGPRAAAQQMKGKADFRNELDRARRKFSVEIERARAGDMYDVMVSGVVVGTILIDARGIGELDYDDTAGPNDRDQRFPRNFPELDGGEVVQVGPLTGSLQLR